MTDTFCDQGTLTLSVGEGYISSREVSTLRRGDVIRTTRLASSPSLLLFNGMPLCPCEVVIHDQRLEFRVIGGDCQGRSYPDRAATDGPTELLPSTVSLGSIRMSLSELQETASSALISLGKDWSEEEDAELLVAGIPTARGKVVAIGEAVGMRVTEAAGATLGARAVHPSGFLLRAGSASAQAADYDFRERYGSASPIVRMNTALIRDHGGRPRELPVGGLDPRSAALMGRLPLMEEAQVLQAILVHGIPSMPYTPRSDREGQVPVVE